MVKASKIVLGKRPEAFTKDVTFPMLDGGEGCMSITYKYRSKSEFAAFYDAFQARLSAEAETEIARFKAAEEAAEKNNEPAPKFSITQSDIIARQAKVSIEFILESVEGWNLEVPFDREAIAELVDTVPAAVKAIIGDYQTAINEGRLGN
ncbi:MULTISPECIES: phage tail assembly chaperone [Massilia]|uniref:Tail assembly chaperone n=1 Tax=Massilia aurea TaxID=373040 RepID=A0A422QRS4_9BURK|nr:MULTISPECIES: phage tail assembly chaperone [Massilia]MDY0962103.1 phage tail assembly chaperone [Massilia sp. CFBP9026]RNF32718.1 hypothetical protein NM04_00505 [Massilia aurea]